MFNEKYKIVIKMDYVHGWPEIVDWVNQNSNKSVDVKFENNYGQEGIYFAFEDTSDALLFKIKYEV